MVDNPGADVLHADGRTTWRRLIQSETDEGIIQAAGDIDGVVELGFGGSGPPFLAWTKTYVFFPLEYDTAPSLGKAPRNPRDEPMEAQ
ncbi:MAG: hypothetical protein V3T24_04745, partial [Longimicrobiales bacterium]